MAAGSGGLLGLFKGSGGSNHNSGYGGYGPNQGYGGGYGGGYGQQPVYAQQQPKKSGLSGGAGLALGNNSVSRSIPQFNPHAISHVQVQVQVCWEVCSSPTLSKTYMILVMMLVLITAMTMVMAASSFWRIHPCVVCGMSIFLSVQLYTASTPV